MTTLPEILVFAVLLVIAAELYFIARELRRAVTLFLKDKDSSDAKAAGPTINVNLGPAPAGTAGLPQNVSVETQNNQESDVPQVSSQTEPEQPVQAAPPPRAKPAPSGVLIVKCPKCQAENSNYRKECFNCGGPL